MGAFFMHKHMWRLVALLCLLAGCADAANDRVASIRYVVDGDTVILKDDEVIRMLGINTPEKKREDRPAEPYALEARLTLIELINGRPIKLIEGVEKKDRHGRTLAYIENADGVDVQLSLLQKGYAMAVAFPPNLARTDSYFEAEQGARDARLGMWQNPKHVTVLPNAKLKSGFQILRGKVHRVSRSNKYIRLSMSDNLTLLILRADWDVFWKEQDAESFNDRIVEARGWVTGSKKNRILKILHPYMLHLI